MTHLIRERRCLGYVGTSLKKNDIAASPGAATTEREQKEQELRERKERLIGYFTNHYVRITYHELGAASTEETEKLIDPLLKLPLTEKEISKWENTDWAEQNIAAAQRLFMTLQNKIEQARSAKLLDARGETDWLSRFRDPNTGYKNKEQMVEQGFDKWMRAAKRLVEQRSSLLKRSPRVQEISRSAVPDIDLFLDQGKFIGLKIKRQRSLFAEIKAALASRELDKDTVYDDARSLLVAAVKRGHFAPQKVGRWLLRAMRMEQPEQFVAKRLPQLLHNWEEIRWEFDLLEARFRESGVPDGCTPLTPQRFLALSYDGCRAYLTNAEKAYDLQSAEQSEAKEALRNAKTLIRLALRKRDWPSARKTLDALWKEHSDDSELAAMENILASGQSDADRHEQTQTPPEQAKKEVDVALGSLPISLRDAALHCAQTPDKGVDAVCTLWDTLYNHEQALNKRYTTQQKEQQDFQDKQLKEETKQRTKEGHAREPDTPVERNILEGETETSLAINDNPEGPQMLYIDESTNAQTVLADGCTRNSGNAKFRYNTSIIPKGISKGENENLVRFTFPRIVRNLHILEDANIPYAYSQMVQPALETARQPADADIQLNMAG